MFEEARTKLTAWYLGIIMAISIGFSVAIFLGINRELIRIDNLQKIRRTRVSQITTFLRTNGLPVPPELQSLDIESVETARARVISVLGIINLSILVLAGAGGYFLAGQTLSPIAKMVDEQKEFVSNASHELRTPLTSLKTEIEVALRDRKISLPDAKKLLASNLEDVDKMQRLSNYLLELNKYESGRIKLNFERVDLKDIIENASERLVRVASKNGNKIVKRLKPATILGDKDSLGELASILIDNAIKYGKRGNNIILGAGTQNGKSFMFVQDFGIGISDEDKPHIFERFYRAETSRSGTKAGGYGLGLSIASSIVALHKGRIEVESKLGKGSVFRVVI